MKRYSKIALSLLMACAIVFSSFAVGVFNIGSVVAEAASVEYGTTYGTLKYDTDGTTATVTGVSANNVKDEIKIPEVITINEVEYTVTAVAAKAFEGNTSLKGIIIPKTVAEIGDNAFYNCTKLASVTFETDARKDSDLVSIGDHAFNGCSALKSIVIPADVEEIGDHTFANCVALATVTFAKNLDENCFIDSIGSYAFYNCTALKTVDLPDSLTSIGQFAYLNCTSITSVTIGKNIKAISTSAFQDCTSLVDVTLDKDLDFANENSKLLSIDASAFQGCTSLNEIKVPHFVTKIGASAFSGCTALSAIYIPDSVKTIGEKAFYKCSAISEVNYEGTENQYNAISIAEYNEELYQGTLNCATTLYIDGPYVHVHKLEKDEDKSYDATCTKDGELHQYCECGYTGMTVLAAKGHKAPKANEDGSLPYVIDKAATCETKGSKSLHCTVCDAIIEETVVELAALGHMWSTSKKVTKAATCTAKGEKAIVCENKDCGVIKAGTKEEIAAKGHSYAKTFTVDKAATCTADGSKSKHCANCDAKTEVTVIPATGHSFGAWVVTKNPTLTEAGSKKRTCSVCGHVETAAIAATAPSSITILPGDVTLNKDQTTLLTVEANGNNVIWVSSNPSIASVDENGKVTAHKKGVVTITATVENTQIFDTCTITVKYTFFQMIASFFSGIVEFIMNFLN